MRELRSSVGMIGRTETRAPQTETAVESASQIVDPVLSRLYAYWDGKRGDRKFPGRCDLDPVDIPSLLPSVFLISVRHLPFDLVFRLAGTTITECVGVEMTGTRVTELPSTAAGALWRQAARAAQSGRPALLSGPSRTRAGAFKRVDYLVLPLGSVSGDTDMLIGGAVFRPYPVGERSFDGGPVTHERVASPFNVNCR